MKRISYGVKILVTALALLTIFSTYFFSLYESWNLVDSFYFTVSTITTVGYGDLVPTSPVTKIITSIISFVGIAMVLTMFGMVSSHYVRIVNEREKRINVNLKESRARQERKIEELKEKVEEVKRVIK